MCRWACELTCSCQQTLWLSVCCSALRAEQPRLGWEAFVEVSQHAACWCMCVCTHPFPPKHTLSVAVLISIGQLLPAAGELELVHGQQQYGVVVYHFPLAVLCPSCSTDLTLSRTCEHCKAHSVVFYSMIMYYVKHSRLAPTNVH
jgi:hypothetical protein